MALDFDALRKKLNTLQGQNNRSSASWKPPAGKSTIRIVPWKENAENPFIELYFHYLGNKTHLSPLTRGNPDPIAEFADKLRSTNDKDDWTYSKQFAPKLRTFVPVIVRGEEDAGVRFWGFGKTVYTELLAVISDPEWGDITDVEAGRDITLEFTPQKESDTNFAKTTTRMKPNQSPLTADAEKLEEWLNKQPDIYEVFSEPTYEVLEAFLERYLNPEEDQSVTTQTKSPAPKTEEVSTESEEEVSTESEDSEEPVVEVTADPIVDDGDDDEDAKTDSSDVAAEFDKLFNS